MNCDCLVLWVFILFLVSALYWFCNWRYWDLGDDINSEALLLNHLLRVSLV